MCDGARACFPLLPVYIGPLRYQIANNLVTNVLLHHEVKWTYTLFDKHAAPHTDSATLTKKSTRSSDKLVPTTRIHGATSHKPIIFTI